MGQQDRVGQLGGAGGSGRRGEACGDADNPRRPGLVQSGRTTQGEPGGSGQKGWRGQPEVVRSILSGTGRNVQGRSVMRAGRACEKRVMKATGRIRSHKR